MQSSARKTLQLVNSNVQEEQGYPLSQVPTKYFHQLLLATNLGNTPAFPINAAEVSESRFTEGVRGTSHFFPVRFAVERNTTQEPRRAFETTLGDAVSCARRRRFDSDRVSHSCSPLLPALLLEGNSDSRGTAAPATGLGRETEPTPNLKKKKNPLLLDPVALSVPKLIEPEPNYC